MQVQMINIGLLYLSANDERCVASGEVKRDRSLCARVFFVHLVGKHEKQKTVFLGEILAPSFGYPSFLLLSDPVACGHITAVSFTPHH